MSPKEIDIHETEERKIGFEDNATNEQTVNENDALDKYLKRLGRQSRASKESPIMPDENKLEVNAHRKSGQSTSPNRLSEKYQKSKHKDSTNIPLTNLSSSSGDYMHYSGDEDFILDELNDLYQAVLSWIFSSKDDADSSRPIRYHMLLSV